MMKNARLFSTTEITQIRSNDKVKAVWDRTLTMVFCDLCIKEKDHNAINRTGLHFQKEGWTRLVANFNKETGKNYEKSQLKNRWDLLKKEWKLWKQLKGNDSLVWDPRKNNIDASAAWWDKRLNVLPEATKFINGGIDPELESRLDRMFQGMQFKDDTALATTFSLVPADGTDEDEPSKVDLEVVTVEDTQIPKKAMVEHLNEVDNHCVMEQNPQPHSESEHQSEPPQKKKRSPESDSSHLNKGKEKVPKLVGRVAKLSRQIDRLCSAAESMSTATSAKLTFEPYNIPEAIRLLDSMEEEVPKKSQLYYFATKLFLDKDKRTMFMSLSTETRAWWLKMEMEESSQVA